MLKELTVGILIISILICGCSSTTKGSIQVTSTPSGAEVYLDNEYRGTTPNTISDVSAGSHTIELRKNGYQSWSTSITVTSGSPSYVSAGLISGISQPTMAVPTPSSRTIQPTTTTTQVYPSPTISITTTSAGTTQPKRSMIVAATGQQKGDQVLVTFQGGLDTPHVISYLITLIPSTGQTQTQLVYGNTVGQVTSLNGATAGRDNVIVDVTFDDGSHQVIVNFWV